jgi:prepilin-type N-terminal cleavage/methylation domain-containing protein
MATPFGSKRASGGFSLVELLAVLAIIGILALAGLGNFGPRSPKATRTLLADLRNDLQGARQAAMAGGKTVKLQLALNAAGNWQLTARDTALAETSPASVLFQDVLPAKAMVSCTLAQAFTDLPTTSTAVTALAPAVSYGFGSGSQGWQQCLATTPSGGWYGINSSGAPVLITGTSPNITAVGLAGGFWIGVLGRTPNASGIPYGVVLMPPTGQVVTYYKGDANLDDSPAHQWTRLE